MQVREKVEKFVTVRPYTLDSDTDLYCEYMNYFHNAWITKEQIEIMKQVPFETITRIRRKICKLQQFRASKEVEEARARRCEEMRQTYWSWRIYLEAVANKITQADPLPF